MTSVTPLLLTSSEVSDSIKSSVSTCMADTVKQKSSVNNKLIYATDPAAGDKLGAASEQTPHDSSNAHNAQVKKVQNQNRHCSRRNC